MVMINPVYKTLPPWFSIPQRPKEQTQPSKKKKIERIYENDDFVIDLFVEEKMVRVSVFENEHYKDEVIIRKEDYI